jgi:hypothetical protein
MISLLWYDLFFDLVLPLLEFKISHANFLVNLYFVKPPYFSDVVQFTAPVLQQIVMAPDLGVVLPLKN